MLDVPENSLPNHTINSLQVYGQEKYLVLHDVDLTGVADALMPSQVMCDVVCLLYDGSDPKSFEYVARVYLVSWLEIFLEIFSDIYFL